MSGDSRISPVFTVTSGEYKILRTVTSSFSFDGSGTTVAIAITFP